MDLTTAADHLYSLAPDRFVAERTALVKQARADGEKDLAAAVQALRKPSAAAWAVNQLVRAEPELVEQLLALGEQLRTAQAALSGDDLRALTRQRGQLVQAVARRARALAADAGTPVSAAVTEEVEETLRAALADPAAGDAVREGRLTSALSYAGLGEVDLSGAVATPPSGRRSTPPAAPPAPEGPSELELKRARRAAEEADEAAAAAVEALETAEVERREAEERREELAAEIAELEEQLEHAQAAAHAAATALRAARRQHETAVRAAGRARRALERLERPERG